MKLKRILALIGVVCLALMYILTLVFSLMEGELAADLFKVSVILTLIIPVLLYVYNMFFRYFQKRGEEIRADLDENYGKDNADHDENQKSVDRRSN